MQCWTMDPVVLLSAFIIIFLQADVCLAENRTQLFRDIFNGYEPRVAPFDTLPDVLHLSGTISLISIRSVNEKDQTFSASIWISMVWEDRRLKWDPDSYKEITTIQTTSKYVWIPSSVCIFNEVTNDKCLTEEKPVTIYNSGTVVYTTSRESTSQCKIDISKYPFDTQTCSLQFGNLFSSSEFIYFVAPHSFYSLAYFDRSEEWEVVDTSVVEYKVPGIQQLHYHLVIKRKPSFIVLTVLVPVIILSILNIFSYVLPIDSGEKMGTSMAIFLTFAVFLTMINDTMPKADSVPPFMVYLSTQLVVSGLTVILEAIVLRVHFSSESTVEKPEKCKVEPIDLDPEQKKIRTWTKIKEFLRMVKSRLTAKRLDMIFMVLVIVTDFVSFIVFMAETS